MKPLLLIITLLLSTPFKAGAEQKPITLSEINQNNNGAMLQYIYASRERLRDYIVEEIFTKRVHEIGLKPPPEEIRRIYGIDHDWIWWGRKSIILAGSRIDYFREDDEIILNLPIYFYGATNKEFNIAIAESISIARYALGISSYVDMSVEPFNDNIETAYLLFRKIFPFSDGTTCKESTSNCASNWSPKLKHIASTIMSKIKVRISVHLPVSLMVMNSWSEHEDFNNLDFQCLAFSEDMGKGYNLGPIYHTMSNGYSGSSRVEKENGSAPVYRHSEIQKYMVKRLNAYLKGAALCTERGIDLREHAINKVLQKGSWFNTQYLY